MIMTSTSRSLIGELDDAVRSGSERDRVDTLRKITDLFLASSARLSDEQIEIFDEVIGHLIKRVESRIVAELSERLAPIENAPNGVIQNLACNDEIAIAGPVLAFSLRLTKADLVTIAMAKGQDHLLAIASRKDLGPSVTDVLLDRGRSEIRHKLADNLAARFSDEGMTRLIAYAEADQTLSGKLGTRMDMPLHLLRRLLEITPDPVRSEMLAAAPASHRAELLGLLQAMGRAPDDGGLDITQVEARLRMMHQNGDLDETVLLQFAHRQQSLELVIALSILCSLEYRAMQEICGGHRAEDLLMPCRAAGISWHGFRAIIAANPVTAGLSEPSIAAVRKDYMRLSISTAQRVLRIRCRQLTTMREAARRQG